MSQKRWNIGNKMEREKGFYLKNELPDHVQEEIEHFSEIIFQTLGPLVNDANSANACIAALNLFIFLCIKGFVKEEHQESVVLNEARSLLKNLEIYKEVRLNKNAENK